MAKKSILFTTVFSLPRSVCENISHWIDSIYAEWINRWINPSRFIVPIMFCHGQLYIIQWLFDWRLDLYSPVIYKYFNHLFIHSPKVIFCKPLSNKNKRLLVCQKLNSQQAVINYIYTGSDYYYTWLMANDCFIHANICTNGIRDWKFFLEI